MINQWINPSNASFSLNRGNLSKRWFHLFKVCDLDWFNIYIVISSLGAAFSLNRANLARGDWDLDWFNVFMFIYRLGLHSRSITFCFACAAVWAKASALPARTSYCICVVQAAVSEALAL